MKTKATFDTTQLIAKVREIAAGHPGTKYEPLGRFTGCKYTQGVCGGGTGCLLGQAMVALQPELLPFLTRLDAGNNQTIHDVLKYNIKIDYVMHHLDWLLEVQKNQDRSKTWVVAVATADQRFPL